MKAMRKIKHRIGIIGFISFFLVLGIVGAVELDTISFAAGAVYSIIFMSFFGFAITINNELDKIVKQYSSKEYEDYRNQKFIQRNSPSYDDTRDYITTLCDNYSISSYAFKPFIDNQLALWVMIRGKQYTIYLDYSTLELIVIANGRAIKTYYGDVAWSNAIKYLRQLKYVA